MSGKSTIQKVKARQSILSKIQDVLLFGAGTREDLKAFDKQLRDDYSTELSNLRYIWEKLYLEILEAQQPPLHRKSKTVIQRLDRLTAQVNRARYGYAPLFNRLGQIQATELASVFDYDQAFNDYLRRLREAEDNIAGSIARQDWTDVGAQVDEMLVLLDAAERRWKGRDKSLRSSEL